MNWNHQTMRKTRELPAIAAIVVITVIFFWPLFQGRTFSMVGAHMLAQYPWATVVSASPEIVGRGFPQTDHADGLYPSSVFATNALRSGQLPMWLPYSFSGVPIMETGAGNGFVYPPQMLATLVLSPIRQHDLLLVTHLLLAGLGMYALLRIWCLNVWGALLGAIVWELNGHNAFFLQFEIVVVAAAWFPLMLLGATLAIRNNSVLWALATGFALGMSVLHGAQHWEYLGTVALVSWYVPFSIFAARKLFSKGARRSALLCLALPIISGITALALSAASWLPLLHLLQHVHRKPYSLEAQMRSTIPISLFIQGLVLPVISVIPMRTIYWTSLGFVGVPALLLIPAGLLRRSAPVAFSIILGIVSVGMIMGLRPLFILLRLVLPYFSLLRKLDFYYLFCFGAAVLAGVGLHEITRRINRPAVRWPLSLKTAVPVVVIALQCFHVIHFARSANPTHPVQPQWLFPETPLISNLKSLQGEFHILPVPYRDPAGKWTPAVLSGKVAVVFDLRSSSGYESLLPEWTAILWRTVEKGGVVSDDLHPAYFPYNYHDRLSLGLLEKLSIGYLATAPNAEPKDIDGSRTIANGSLQLMYKGRDGCIYKLNHALPRAFVVPSVIPAADALTSLHMLVDKKFDARRAAITIGEETAAKTGLPTIDSSTNTTAASATIVTDRVNVVEIDVNTPQPGMLVLNDSWDSGWKAKLDGVERPVFRVNYAFRGVVVPPGKHTVTFMYRPPLLLMGLVISAVTLLLLTITFSLIGITVLRRIYKTRSESNF